VVDNRVGEKGVAKELRTEVVEKRRQGHSSPASNIGGRK